METSKESVLQRSSRASIPSSPARAASGSLIPKGNLQKPSFLEFVTFERVKVVSMLGLALALCNADRVVMSVAIVPLSQAYGWSRSFAGIVQLSFLWGYLMSPIIGGVLVDYYGGKIVMACDVTLWSMATFLTPRTALCCPWHRAGEAKKKAWVCIHVLWQTRRTSMKDYASSHRMWMGPNAVWAQPSILSITWLLPRPLSKPASEASHPTCVSYISQIFISERRMI